jgi:hypothetical protein
MKKLTFILLLFVIAMAGRGQAYGQEKAPQEVIEIANSKIIQFGQDEVIVNAVKAENAKGKTLDQIKALDKKWKETPGIDDFMKSIMVSECGKHLQNLQEGAKYITEIFVMDNQGANVAMSDKTSDYWQGDEDKFTESYNGGKGAVHISDVEFDDSSQTYVVQVSVPVKDGSTVIGAITVSIDVDKME